MAADAEAPTTGRQEAKRARLADFIAKLGRSCGGELRCVPAIADLAMSGVYPVDDTKRLLDPLGQTSPVRVLRFTHYWASVTALSFLRRSCCSFRGSSGIGGKEPRTRHV